MCTGPGALAGRSKVHWKKTVGLLVVVAALMVLVPGASATVAFDLSGGTNAVAAVGEVITVGGGIMLPIVLGVIGVCAGIGLYYRMSRKAKISS